MKMTSWLARLLVGTAMSACASAGAWAQQGDTEAQRAPKGQSGDAALAASEPSYVNEIVVTAERRAERLSSLPLAISAYSTETLKDRGVADLNSLSLLSPSIRVPENANGGLGVNVVIRGVGSFGGFEPAVAMVQDGVSYASRRIGTFDFFDVERVEVLRGPQGTLGGRNATAGGVYVISAKPSSEPGGYLEATVGNYDRIAVEGAVTGPIAGDKLLFRLAAQVDKADGWITETQTGNTYGGIDKRQARLYLLGRPSDSLEMSLILQARVDEALPATVSFGRSRPDRPSLAEANGALDFNPDTRTMSQDRTDIRKDEFFQGTFRLAWDLSDNLQLVTTSGYVKSKLLYNEDQDHTTVAAVLWGPNPRRQPFEQLSQEVTLSGQISDRLDFIVGGLYLDYDYKLRGDVGFPFFGIPAGGLAFLDNQKLTSRSGYGQVRFDVTDTVRLTAGARYTHDKKSSRAAFNTLTSSGSLTGSAWTPRVSIDWKPSENVLVYATASRGYKSGGFDEFAFPSRSYNPEYVWNYEVGLKASTADRRLSGNLTGFIMDYSNLQQAVLGLDPGEISFRTINSSKAKIRGIEAELEVSPMDGLRFNGSVAYLDTEYDGLRTVDPLYPELGDAAPGNPALRVRDLTGNRLAGAPKWQFNVGGDYKFPVGEWQGRLNASYSWNSEVPLDIYNNPGFSQDSVGILSGSISLADPSGDWEVSAFSTNLTNEFYTTNAVAADVGGGGASRVTSFGDVRRYGIRVRRQF
ncbi:MAG: TonB-dependent receptor [Phenylobacterium sp.]|uniref:TonB-dependent receptor n=1 Tax=Phenylobacterium sp. TaxID=1871053 RepID=UPI00273595A3|nr:TonB-dependent receptor [Phenylobacterium sp.]MDP3748630.1 TonB-dependent receptor [Phenylobacterium sp.]